uniref:Putative secreted protein n=1 Tax=Ixodes ricinus TaxID=34613 RepID=A0A6B0U9B8_IXORI
MLDSHLLRQRVWARFLWTMQMYPGGWTQASPSTCTGTPSSPVMVMRTDRHWAMRWCCRLMTRDAAICTVPKTATTSRILSSMAGA